MESASKYLVVELMDESDDLIGYGVCVETTADGKTSWAMLPEVHGGRTDAHIAARNAETKVQA